MPDFKLIGGFMDGQTVHLSRGTPAVACLMDGKHVVSPFFAVYLLAGKDWYEFYDKESVVDKGTPLFDVEARKWLQLEGDDRSWYAWQLVSELN